MANSFVDITLLDSQLYSGWLILGKVGIDIMTPRGASLQYRGLA